MFFYTMYIATALKDRSLSALVVGITASSINLPTSSLAESHNSTPSTMRMHTQPKIGAARAAPAVPSRLLRPWCMDLECIQFCLSMLS